MKHSIVSFMQLEKLSLLKESMTENSKNACRLLLSVILLTGTVTGIAGPLDDCVRQMADQTTFMRKEIVLYREFDVSRDRGQKQVQQRIVLQKLREQVPEEIDAEKELQRIYRLAGLHGITVHIFKQVADNPVRSQTTGNRINRLVWETEFSGTWHDLISFFNDIETQGPCTRIEALQIRRSGETGKDIIPSGTGRCTELSVRGRICVYYRCKNTTA